MFTLHKSDILPIVCSGEMPVSGRSLGEYRRHIAIGELSGARVEC